MPSGLSKAFDHGIYFGFDSRRACDQTRNLKAASTLCSMAYLVSETDDRAGLKLAIERGWLVVPESGTFSKVSPEPGADPVCLSCGIQFIEEIDLPVVGLRDCLRKRAIEGSLKVHFVPRSIPDTDYLPKVLTQRWNANLFG